MTTPLTRPVLPPGYPAGWAQWVSEQRARLCLTQEQFAVLIGYTGSTVSKWERALKMPDRARREHIASRLMQYTTPRKARIT
jgi:transcriptional regulator with XRE-family HTH domain